MTITVEIKPAVQAELARQAAARAALSKRLASWPGVHMIRGVKFGQYSRG
jgi:hypothetical protein